MNSKASIATRAALLFAFAFIHHPAFSQEGGPPAPGPEHALLKRLEGQWSAKMKMGDSESAATATYKMECGGMWLVSDFRGMMAGGPFQGRGLDGYDPAKGKYVSVWVDSWSTTPLMLEGTYDKEAKKLTMTGTGPGSDGSPVKYRMLTHYKDDNHHTFTMYVTGGGGQEQLVLTIDYQRKQ
ncbi:MAG TPA: hypothetical protein DCY13_12410 [Verrucomicrobiales bacterium]|nr:hypothetical protein [Verrucomicrobiales bacterium]